MCKPALTEKDVRARLQIKSRQTLYQYAWVMALRRGIGPRGEQPYRWDADEFEAAFAARKQEAP